MEEIDDLLEKCRHERDTRPAFIVPTGHSSSELSYRHRHTPTQERIRSHRSRRKFLRSRRCRTSCHHHKMTGNSVSSILIL